MLVVPGVDVVMPARFIRGGPSRCCRMVTALLSRETIGRKSESFGIRRERIFSQMAALTICKQYFWQSGKL
jgi:hypothetical protein